MCTKSPTAGANRKDNKSLLQHTADYVSSRPELVTKEITTNQQRSELSWAQAMRSVMHDSRV